MSSFTDGKPRVATEADCKAEWCCGKSGERFRCGFCGHKFQIGDVWRWIFTNDIPGAPGNPFICEKCDGPDVRERWTAKWTEWRRLYREEFWWFNGRSA